VPERDEKRGEGVRMKKCSRCGETKPTTEYYGEKRAAGGLAPHCKKCHNMTREQKEAQRAKIEAERAARTKPGYKMCSVCKEEKLLADFYFDKRSTDGAASNCKACHSLIKRAWTEKQQVKREAEKAAELAAKMALGEKACTKCGEVKPFAEFHRDPRATDGMYSHCKACHYQMTRAYEKTEHGSEVVRKLKRRYYYELGGRERSRTRSANYRYRQKRSEYAKSEAGKRAQKRKDQKRFSLSPDKIRAKNAVNNAVKRGDLPPASTQLCRECGGPAQEYHHESYAKEDWLKVVPLCKVCHATTYTNPYTE
jgi:hypothetical protein